MGKLKNKKRKKKDEKEVGPIIVKDTLAAINETLKPEKLRALFCNSKYSHYLCGTSPSESFHSQLEYYKNKHACN